MPPAGNERRRAAKYPAPLQIRPAARTARRPRARAPGVEFPSRYALRRGRPAAAGARRNAPAPRL